MPEMEDAFQEVWLSMGRGANYMVAFSWYRLGWKDARKRAAQQVAEADRPSIAKQVLERAIDEGHIDDSPDYL